MELESLFDFISPETIRIKGTRVGIEIAVENYLDGRSPEEITLCYPSLSLGQIYATITYYLCNKEKIDVYVKASQDRVEAAWQEQRRNPHPGVKRILEIKAQREAEALAKAEDDLLSYAIAEAFRHNKENLVALSREREPVRLWT